jgi:hypothetical protein
VAVERTSGVDTEVALDFMREILSRLDRADLSAMTTDLEAKSCWARQLLDDQAGRLPRGSAPEAGRGLPDDPTSEQAAYRLLRAFFPSRRRAREMVGVLGGRALLGATYLLVSDEGTLGGRVESFVSNFVPFEEVAEDLAWELLHLHDPSRYWLWNRWVWSERTETGALRLLTSEDVDLWGGNPLGTYQKVGAAMAVVHDTVRALGMVEESPYGLDVFLANVYGVYMYTVLRMRMSQEFNRIVPELPSLARRLLGIHERVWEESRCR